MARCDFETARDLSTLYFNAHPDDFNDYIEMVESSKDEDEAVAKVVAAVEKLRDAGLLEHSLRGEVFHFHRWHPQQIGGNFGPLVRNDGGVHPAVRNH